MIDQVQFNDQGLVPAIIQDSETKEVLTLAYMNKESLAKTIETGETWLFSRSRNELWHKGETSGHTQKVVEMKWDCDQDAILVQVLPNGVACHKGEVSCFHETIYTEEEKSIAADYQILKRLEEVIAEREHARPDGAYTTYLFDSGIDKILKKVGEESAEVIIAAKNRDREELKWESADLLYHLMVLLREQELPFAEVLNVLKKRHEEKKPVS
ncbi:bifunctional phosphoribosyl-AMP cyclohydrolase/phosphoribosyl-ATP diphosphatase HisIE [Cytobacillus sp. Sa5YUA1]|uniref:Histidine biosynthesis bifunctional protein HisIE n=1 Tax=Cytobacillus stercorigallinarum TaxID=2762240 RepID=A0ABR8QND6_9BACI|nr:bifunctional phosphoribosyl-AMP cyclohydrolase/phosphoribosyl-ATP diphosphatase HisIE [Cytobacillus stercorigallinarum]MBD7937045.1 bifunctional phosphoribosyl-AMP cyclohydrolase/phosphoribosyl-ATP diphosphatase HisIE [Cytobacillus stercorigallinarum]